MIFVKLFLKWPKFSLFDIRSLVYLHFTSHYIYINLMSLRKVELILIKCNLGFLLQLPKGIINFLPRIQGQQIKLASLENSNITKFKKLFC